MFYLDLNNKLRHDATEELTDATAELSGVDEADHQQIIIRRQFNSRIHTRAGSHTPASLLHLDVITCYVMLFLYLHSLSVWC